MNVSYAMIAVYVVRSTPTGGHEFLQLRRRRDDYMGGTWQTVRGTAHPGETAWQAARRELREETGLAPAEFYKLSGIETFYLVHNETTYHVPSFCAIVPTTAKVVLNEEHDEYRWLPRETAASHFMWPSERPLLAEVCAEILDDGPTKQFLRLAVAP